jgi:hypothetical protein
MVTRRQHFVFRHYLDFWATNRKVRALRAEKQFDTNPVNLAVGRDFYGIKRLTKEDIIVFEKLMCSPPMAGRAIEANRQWAERYVEIGEASHAVSTNPKLRDADRDVAQGVRIGLFEKLHEGIEARAVGMLASIKDGDIEFLERDTEVIDFLCYISHQMFRTKNMRDQLIGNLSSLTAQESIQKLQGLIAFCMAETVAGSLYMDRKNYSAKVLKTKGADEFITSDQPVINLLGTGDGTPPEHLVLYYPMGADRALLYFQNDLPFANVGEFLPEHEVRQLNLAMLRNSHEFLFSSTRFDLLNFSRSIESDSYEVPSFIQELLAF